MTRRQNMPLRALTDGEKDWLKKIAHSRNEPISHVIRAREILSVAKGKSYIQAAHQEGRESGDPVADLVKRFNQEGMNAIQPGHGGGPELKYTTWNGIGFWLNFGAPQMPKKMEPKPGH